MDRFFTRPWLRAISGLFVNFSAGYFGLAFITPNLTNISNNNAFAVLTWNILFGIVFLLASVKTEAILDSL